MSELSWHRECARLNRCGSTSYGKGRLQRQQMESLQPTIYANSRGHWQG